MYIVVVLIMFVCLEAVFGSSFLTLPTRKRWCFKAKHRFGIEPGKSYGMLPKDLQQEYTKIYDCNEFFCKNHTIGKVCDVIIE